MKRLISLILFLSLSFGLVCNAQITLEYCQQKARENYPLIASFGLIEKTKNYNIDNANKNYLPQISLSGKISYQSQVTEIPIKIPSIEIPELTKDQYQAIIQLEQIIWDGGSIKSNKNISKAQYEINKANLEVNLFSLRDRISDLFFGILLIKEQITQTMTLEKELYRNVDKVKSYVENGIANQSDLDAVKIEVLNNKQRQTELHVKLESYCNILSAFISERINTQSDFKSPDDLLSYLNSLPSKIYLNKRPEINSFNAQYSLLDSQKDALQSKNMPRIGAFVQGGYGRPGLNMLSNEFEWFAIAGLRLNWNFGNLYTLSTEKKQISNSQSNVINQKETFIFNTNMQLEQQRGDIERLQKLLSQDQQIISLRTSIKKNAEFRVENGTMNVTDLMKEITNEDMAKQSKILKEIQLLQAIYKFKNIIND